VWRIVTLPVPACAAELNIPLFINSSKPVMTNTRKRDELEGCVLARWMFGIFIVFSSRPNAQPKVLELHGDSLAWNPYYLDLIPRIMHKKSVSARGGRMQ
jgi:hypothetical protein